MRAVLLPALLAWACTGGAPDTAEETDDQDGACGEVSTWDVEVRGKVVDAAEVVVPGAAVQLEDRGWEAGTLLGTATTDDDGLFTLDAFTKRTRFRFPADRWERGFTVAWIALVLLYPAIGWPLGHTYPKVLLPLFPCPLTVYATALVAAAVPQVDRKVFVALLPWALLGLPKCFGALACYEDWGLFAAGVYGLIRLIRNWRPIKWRARLSATAGSPDG